MLYRYCLTILEPFDLYFLSPRIIDHTFRTMSPTTRGSARRSGSPSARLDTVQSGGVRRSDRARTAPLNYAAPVFVPAALAAAPALRNIPEPPDTRVKRRGPWGFKTDAKQKDFRKGQVIWIRYHKPSIDVLRTVGEPEISMTNIGPVYSKNRAFVILWKTWGKLICVPMFTFGGDGIQRIKSNGWGFKEYVEIIHEGRTGFQKISGAVAEPLKMKLYNTWTLHPKACIHAGSIVTVDRQEDINFMGELTGGELDRLVTLVKAIQKNAIENFAF